MTFLHYVCCELLGPPVYGSSWFCPACDPDGGRRPDPRRGGRPAKGKGAWASFSVRPPMGHHRIKWKCHRCQRWGDAYDLLRLLYPDMTYDQREQEVRRLSDDYEGTAPAISPLGEGKTPARPTIAQRGVGKGGGGGNRATQPTD